MTSSHQHLAVAAPASRWPSFGTQVLIGMAAGIALGLLAREAGGPDAALGVTLRTVGQIFVQLLKALVPALVFTAIVASVAALRDVDDAARLVVQTLVWFAITAFLAVSVGLLLGLWFQPGAHAGVDPGLAARPGTTGGWLDFLKSVVPGNLLGLQATTTLKDGSAATALSFNVLQTIVVAIAVGAAAVRIGEPGAPFLAFNASALAILRRLLRWVIALTPLGSAALIGDAIVRYGWNALGSLGVFAGTIYLGLAVVLFVIYPILLALHGVRPLWFFRQAWPAIQLGFVSRSSVGTLPVTEDVAERALGIPRSYAAFAILLGATTKMDGCAGIYPAVAALFVAQFYGVPLHAVDYGLIVLVSVLGSAATAGLTGATVMLTLTLSTLGLPLEGVGLLLAIDPIIDMGRTAVNVAGQLVAPLIVARRTNLLPGNASAFAETSAGPVVPATG